MQFTPEELNQISLLINRANITGQEATTVAVLQQKLTKLIQESASPKKPDAGKKDK